MLLMDLRFTHITNGPQIHTYYQWSPVRIHVHSALHCVAVCCSMLQRAVCCSMLQPVRVPYISQHQSPTSPQNCRTKSDVSEMWRLSLADQREFAAVSKRAPSLCKRAIHLPQKSNISPQKISVSPKCGDCFSLIDLDLSYRLPPPHISYIHIHHIYIYIMLYTISSQKNLYFLKRAYISAKKDTSAEKTYISKL